MADDVTPMDFESWLGEHLHKPQITQVNSKHGKTVIRVYAEGYKSDWHTAAQKFTRNNPTIEIEVQFPQPPSTDGLLSPPIHE